MQMVSRWHCFWAILRAAVKRGGRGDAYVQQSGLFGTKPCGESSDIPKPPEASRRC